MDASWMETVCIIWVMCDIDWNIPSDEFPSNGDGLVAFAVGFAGGDGAVGEWVCVLS